jgi:hypothetical protein
LPSVLSPSDFTSENAERKKENKKSMRDERICQKSGRGFTNENANE